MGGDGQAEQAQAGQARECEPGEKKSQGFFVVGFSTSAPDRLIPEKQIDFFFFGVRCDGYRKRCVI